MTERIHNTTSYQKTVGIIEVVNDPQTDRDKGGMPQAKKDTLTQVYYPQALQAVRDKETNMSIPDNKRLHVQFMDKLWGAGDPKSNLPSFESVVFDDHNYVSGAISQGEAAKQGDYMWYTCNEDDRLTDGDTPKIVQEFSLAVLGSIENSTELTPDANQNFYSSVCMRRRRVGSSGHGKRN